MSTADANYRNEWSLYSAAKDLTHGHRVLLTRPATDGYRCDAVPEFRFGLYEVNFPGF